MSWVGGNNRDKRLARLRELLQQDIDRVASIFAEHIRDNWFPNAGSHVDLPGIAPYDGQLRLTRISKIPEKMYALGNERNKLLFQLSLLKEQNGNCNFPRDKIIQMADAIAKETGVLVFPDFSALPDGYTGEMSDINAFRNMPDIYGTDL